MKVGPNGTGSILNYTYEYYDGSGHNNNRIRSITDGVDSAYSVSYTYDQWNRLTNATAGAYSRQYLYDAFGNLKSVGGSGGPNPNYVLNYLANNTGAPLTNRILSVTENGQTQPFYYDNAGNLTQGDGMTYAYDAANRMTSVNNGALGQYGYDGEGMRVKKVEGGQTVWYVRSSVLKQALFEVTTQGINRADVYRDNGKLLAQLSTDGQFYWAHHDHLWSVRKLTDQSGAVRYRGEFDPHGQAIYEWSATGNTNLNSEKFATYERDAAVNLDYAEARSYKYGRARFSQPDPANAKQAEFKGADLKHPQSLNRYSYVMNDPVNFFDPAGKFLGNPFCNDVYMDGFFMGNSCSGIGILMDGPMFGGGGTPEPWQAPTITNCNITLGARALN